MGFSQKLFLIDDDVPTKFHCQEDRKRRLSPEAVPIREVFLKRQRKSLVTECLESQSKTKTHVECIQTDENIEQEVVTLEELPKSQDKKTSTEIIITADKSIQVTIKVTKHFRSKAVQATSQNKNVSISPLQVCTSSFTSPFKIEHLQPSQSGVVEAAKRKIVHEDERSDSDISRLGSDHSSPFVPTSSRVTDLDSTDTEYIEQLQSLKNTIRLIEKKIYDVYWYFQRLLLFNSIVA
ncbi:hypothetical protein FQR65_LT08156 [Abscondita terminalis]|nr:hypothetical protein FQR65_LT08156 [Abscondita terminalis]